MSDPYDRREFLGIIGAGAAGAALAGCATGPQASARPVGRVVVVGGGFGGATAAKYVRMWSRGRIEVFLVERNPNFVSCPLSNLVLGGSRGIEDLTVGYGGLRAHGVRVIRDEVTDVDPAKKRVRLQGEAELSYDRLVIAPGVDFMVDSIAGLQDPEAQKIFLHAWKAGPETVALRRQIEDMNDGGVFVLAIPKMPYRCPPGPYERACLVASYFKQAKPKSKVLILDANEDIVSKRGLFLAAWKDLYPGLIEYQPNQEVKEAVAQTRTVKTDFDAFKGDVVNILPPMRAGRIAARAQLITANNRWCGVHWLTMESLAAPGIHVIGDATLSASAMPKSGSVANNQAKVCASAVVALMTGQPVDANPVLINACYSYVSPSEAVHVASVHRYDAEKKTFVTVPGSGGLSGERSTGEKQLADSWARNIWADTLG